jgi:hypothetical protein
LTTGNSIFSWTFRAILFKWGCKFLPRGGKSLTQFSESLDGGISNRPLKEKTERKMEAYRKELIATRAVIFHG